MDNNFNVQKSIDLPQSIGIYSTFCGKGGNELLLYSPNDNLLLYCDIVNAKNTLIDISKVFSSCLSPVYHWDDRIILLTTYDKRFYRFDLSTKQLDEVTTDFVRLNHQFFNNFYQKVAQSGFGYQINSLQQSFIYKDETNKEIIFFDFKHNKKTTIKDPESDYHDIVFYKGCCIFVSEDNLIITEASNSLHYPIQDPLYIYLRARFVMENDKLSIIVLISNKSDHKINKLI